MFRSMRQRFGTIHWKLTLSYVLVSSLLALTVDTGFLITAIFLERFEDEATPEVLANEAAIFARDLRPIFEDMERSPANLSLRLESIIESYAPRTRIGNDDGSYIQVVSSARFGALFDTNGNVIATTYGPDALIGELDVLPVRELAGRAIQGTTNTADLVLQIESGGIAATAPIAAANGTILGVVYIRSYTLSPQLWLEVLPSYLVLFVAPRLALFVGAGLLVAWFAGRGIRRRLKQLTATSAAFAHGNLAQRITDPSSDELGQLGRQFNTMADQLAEHMRMLQRLADQNAQLAQQAAHLATIEERNRLARDLHDSVKQHVFAASMKLGAVQELGHPNWPSALTLVSTAADSIEQAKRELTAIIPALRPHDLEDEGLSKALSTYLHLWGKQTGITTTYKSDLDGISLSAAQEQALFRIVQEALTNIARHSGATRAHYELVRDGAYVSLCISDNGTGFDPGVVRAGLGLRSMRERAEAIGGVFSIQSNEHGTQIVVEGIYLSEARAYTHAQVMPLHMGNVDEAVNHRTDRG